jgi:4-cresol dehydrogenase (hydroxylating)
VPVLLDLSQMNKILAVDAKSAFALVEPGVSHAQLAAHLAEKSIGFWVDGGRDPEESIAGAIWERSFGYSAYGDRLMMQCGMELMLTDGSLLRTGMGALPGENSWQLFKYGFGPYADGTFTQSSYAVMTKVGFWLSPEPPAYRPFALRITGDDALAPVMEAVRMLRINMIVANTLALTDKASETELTGDPEAAVWNVFGALYGLPKNVEVIWKMLGGLVSSLPGTRLQQLDPGAERASLMAGRPSSAAKGFQARTAGRSLRAVFALPIEGKGALDFVRTTRKASDQAGLQVHIEQCTSWRALLAETVITFDAGQQAKAVELGHRLVTDWARRGVGVVRASPALTGTAAGTYSDPGLATIRSRLAGALA